MSRALRRVRDQRVWDSGWSQPVAVSRLSTAARLPAGVSPAHSQLEVLVPAFAWCGPGPAQLLQLAEQMEENVCPLQLSFL